MSLPSIVLIDRRLQRQALIVALVVVFKGRGSDRDRFDSARSLLARVTAASTVASELIRSCASHLDCVPRARLAPRRTGSIRRLRICAAAQRAHQESERPWPRSNREPRDRVAAGAAGRSADAGASGAQRLPVPRMRRRVDVA